MADANQEKLERFKKLGIPVPLPPVDMATMNAQNVKNKEVAERLAALKSGKLKHEVKKFAEKDGLSKEPSTNIPTTRNNQQSDQQQKVNAPVLETFAPTGAKFDDIDALLYGGGSSRIGGYTEPVQHIEQPVYNPRVINENRLPDENGTQFVNETRVQLEKRLAEKYGRPVSTPQTQKGVLQEGQIIINEDELNQKIIEIATNISKNLIKKFMAEYEKGLINENKNVKKAEIIGQNIVKIEGKTFKLTPVVLKAATK